MATAPVVIDRPEVVEEEKDDLAVPWLVFIHNDPVNVMPMVVIALTKVFGYSKEKASTLMLEAHQKGKAVVSTGEREKAESDCAKLHSYGLWATMAQDR